MSTKRSLSLLAVSGLTYAALGMMPATAISNLAAPASSPFCSASDLLNGGSPAAAVSGRGEDAREPDLGEVHEDLPVPAKGRPGARK